MIAERLIVHIQVVLTSLKLGNTSNIFYIYYSLLQRFIILCSRVIKTVLVWVGIKSLFVLSCFDISQAVFYWSIFSVVKKITSSIVQYLLNAFFPIRSAISYKFHLSMKACRLIHSRQISQICFYGLCTLKLAMDGWKTYVLANFVLKRHLVSNPFLGWLVWLWFCSHFLSDISEEKTQSR